MADQAGIDLILSAPDVKPIMDQVIDDWKEISRQEKEATAQLELFNEEMKEQQLRMKAIAVESQKIKDATRQLNEEAKKRGIITDEQIDKELFAAEHQQKGIFGTIKAYFAQRAELKKLGSEIDSVTKSIRTLQLRQDAISLSARRGNTVAIKEFAANEKAIGKLNNQLGLLNERYEDQAAKLEFSKSKLSGFVKVFNFVKAGALAAAAAIGVIGAVALAGIYAIGRQNDQVQNQFKKVQDNVKKLKFELSAAFSPVAISIGKILEVASDKFSNFIEDNSQAIFDWSKKVAGTIAYVVGYIEAFFPYIGNLFDKLTKDIQISLQVLRLAQDPTEFLRGGIDKVNKLLEEKARLENETPINPIANAQKREKEILDFLDKYTLAQARRKNLTEEELEAIRKLREEYAKLRSELSKQLEAQNIKDAGPFAGLLLKADLDARAIQAIGEKAVDVAKKLRKSAEEIRVIEDAVARLVKSVKEEAINSLIEKENETIDEFLRKLEDLRAIRNRTTEDLKFKREIEDLFKKLNENTASIQARLNDERNHQNRPEIIKKILSDLEKANRITFDLANATALDFASKKAIQVLEKNKIAVEEKIKSLEEVNARLTNSLEQIGPGNAEGLLDLRVRISVNDTDLAVANEHLRQLDDSLKKFKETGVAGVVETEAIIKIRIERGQVPINTNPNTDPERAGGVAFPTDRLAQGLDFAAELYATTFNTIDQIVLGSIDRQIEAIDRLVQSRDDSVARLQHQLELEAEFKANGLANDYALTKKQLNDEVKLRDDAQKKAIELADKRAKAQRSIETQSQISSIITAIANVFAATTLGNPFGVPLAIAQTVALIAAFAASKIQAAKAVRAYKGSRRTGETFGTLAPGEGYDDTPGHDRGLSVVDKDGNLRGFMGGDEYLHKQSVSKKHRKAFDYLNNNESKFRSLDMLEMLKGYENTKQVFRLPDFSDVPRIDYARITRKNERLRERMVKANSRAGITKEEMYEAIDQALVKQTQAMIAYHESRPDIIPNDWLKDYTEITSKSKKKFKKN